jgi:hypothetical protein
MRCTPQHLAITIVALCLGLGTGLQAGAHEGPTGADGLGHVHFAVSCTDAVQAQFHRAMALYHSFDWPRGKAAFEEIVSLDPRCGMAYWGLVHPQRDKNRHDGYHTHIVTDVHTWTHGLPPVTLVSAVAALQKGGCKSGSEQFLYHHAPWHQIA